MDRRAIMSPITSEFFYSQLAWGTRAENFKVGSFGGGRRDGGKDMLLTFLLKVGCEVWFLMFSWSQNSFMNFVFA